jgi:acetylornithine deacetylase/succinyl-diaminopimelate desuccinylase-like protein
VNSYHGKNERISIRNYNNMINFYFNLVKNTDNLGFETVNNLHIEL